MRRPRTGVKPEVSQVLMALYVCTGQRPQRPTAPLFERRGLMNAQVEDTVDGEDINGVIWRQEKGWKSGWGGCKGAESHG